MKITEAEAVTVWRRCASDPIFFANHVLGVDLAEYQCEIIRQMLANRRVAVRSCHGVGKTFVCAVIVLWFLFTKPESKVITTAPTWRQVKDLLWSEIRSLHARAERNGWVLGGVPSATRLEVDPEWYATGLSSNIVENFLGYHAKSILFLVDEASGVPQEILDAAKGYATNSDAYELYVGNPTQVSGGLYDAFTVKAAHWAGIHIGAFDSPNFTEKNLKDFPSVREYMERKGIPYSTEAAPPAVLQSVVGPQYVADALTDWGEESPLFAVKVLGEFPSTTDNTVCGLGDVEAAMNRYADWKPTPGAERIADLQCDVARFGSDETVIGQRDIDPTMDRVSILESVNGRDLMGTAGAIVKHARELKKQKIAVRRIVVDDAGLGGGVVDRLRELQKREGNRPIALDPKIQVIAFNGGQSPKSKNDYPNRRSEAWFAFVECLPTTALEPDKKLLQDLVAPTYTVDSRGRRVVEQKSETKKRLSRSPDRADTVLMGHAPIGAVQGKKAKRRVY